ncbi:hypothetical protein D9V28_03490 [Mycetocola zhadangensis]|uniref:DUF2157 domain-containing protein n=2 Tax=Mycetocola zhadangensis TaxID=1164595 RepID=A0A3L7JBP9_9MICO|nr:hypothetical protein D9V28_03490 [Mycetocola zhadangensis]
MRANQADREMARARAAAHTMAVRNSAAYYPAPHHAVPQHNAAQNFAPQNVAQQHVAQQTVAPQGAAPLSAWYPEHPPAPPAAASTEPARPRRSGIQILMLTVGVILVSIMAIFFVLLAYLIASLEVRSVLTAVASVAVFGIAWLLHRRRLSGTAQGIAALAVVLLLLDLWIIRANDLFGSGGVDGWLYSGLATGIFATLLAVGIRALPLRTLSLSAVLLAPFGVFALTLGILRDAAPTTPVWAALTAVGAAALSWPLIRFGPIERGVVRALGVVAATFAILPAAIAFPGPVAGPVISLTLLAFVWLGHLLVSPFQTAPATAPAANVPGSKAPQVASPVAPPATSVMQLLIALGLGFTVAAVGPAVWLRLPELSATLWAPAVLAMLGAVILAAIARLPQLAARSGLLSAATVVPLSVGALATLPAICVTFGQFAAILSVREFSLAVTDNLPLVLPDSRWTVVLGLVLVTVLMASALAILGRLRGTGWVPAALGGLGLVALCFALSTPTLAGFGFLALAAGALVATSSRRLPKPYRIVAAATVALATPGVFFVGLTSTVTFPLAVLATLAIVIVFRQVVGGAARAARWLTPLLVAVAITVLLGSVRLVADWFETVTGTTTAHALPALSVSFCALAILLAIPLTARVFSRAESATAGAVTVIPLAAGLLELSFRIGTDAVPFLVICGIAAGAAVLWQVVRGVAAWPERYVAALVAPALAVIFAAVLWDQFDSPRAPVAAAAAVVVLAGAALVLFRPEELPGRSPRFRPNQLARIAWDVALGFCAAALIVRAVPSNDLGWAILLLLAVAAVIVASGDGGVVRGSRPRRHIAWVGLPLAVGSLWMALIRADVTGIEFYTLPVAGLLLTIFGLIVMRREPTANATGRTVLFAAALSIALLPTALASDPNEPLRGVLVVAAAAGLLIGGPFLPSAFRGTPVAIIAWLAGTITATLTVLVLSQRGASEGWQNETVACLLLIGGILWLYRRRSPALLGTAAIALAPVLVAVPTTNALVDGTAEFWRFFAVLLFTSTLSLLASLPRVNSPLVRWTALAAAALVAVVAVGTGLADPFEEATVPIAIALLIGGAVRMAFDFRARSWPELGAGVLLLLVPSLLADFGNTELWRVIALGVVALAVFGAGVTLKLSAPTLVGATVLVVHALAQLWPWISGLYGIVPWWLWAGIGGVILIVGGATYEKRIRDLRSAARSISSLR